MATPDDLRRLGNWYRDWAKAGNDAERKQRFDLAHRLEQLATDLEHIQRESGPK